MIPSSLWLFTKHVASSHPHSFCLPCWWLRQNGGPVPFTRFITTSSLCIDRNAAWRFDLKNEFCGFFFCCNFFWCAVSLLYYFTRLDFRMKVLACGVFIYLFVFFLSWAMNVHACSRGFLASNVTRLLSMALHLGFVGVMARVRFAERRGLRRRSMIILHSASLSLLTCRVKRAYQPLPSYVAVLSSQHKTQTMCFHRCLFQHYVSLRNCIMFYSVYQCFF